MTGIEKLRGFANRVMESWPYGDVDGADLRRKAVVEAMQMEYGNTDVKGVVH